MDCPSCGTDNPSSAISCRACGRDLPGQAGGDGASSPAVDQDARTLIFSDEPDLPGFGSRYEVKRLLGQGGMGAVYHAWDRELDRDIALKEIRPELVDQPDVIARFKREIQLASEITHPNVLRVYDLGAAEGKRFLTMQYVDGMTLSAHLRRLGLPETPEIVAIFSQLCAALAAAHDKGVVHRDMKPGNVMIDAEGQAFVMDFGLARSLALSGLTQTGAILGTPHYMSPEQVSGQKVDARTDVYALGVMLFQMLTGELPFQGESTFEIMMQRVQKDPPSVHNLNPEIPSYLRKILERCMERDPSLRYADAGEILADLDAQQVETNFLHQVKKRRKPLLRLAVGVLLALIVAGGFWLGQRSETRSDPSEGVDSDIGTETGLPDAPSLAVVPFSNRTGETSLDWFGEGVARLVMDNLAQSRHVRVVSMDRIQNLLADHGGNLSAATAAASGIDHLLTGEIMKGPNGLTVTARLTDTSEGRELASKRLDGLDEELLIQGSDDLAAATRQGLGIPPTESVDVYAADFASSNPAAYQAYVQGLAALSNYQYDAAETRFAEALELAPDFTMARYRLAFLKSETGRVKEALEDIRGVVEGASRLSDREARYVRAGEAYLANRNDEAEAAYREILESYPYELEARFFLSYLLAYSGNREGELDELKILAQLEPNNPTVWSMMGDAHLALGELNQAVTEFRRYLELLPDSANGHHLLADAYRAQGEFDLAVEEYTQALELDPEFYYATVSRAVTNVLRGQREAAKSDLVALVENEAAAPGSRVDAGFELAAILRGEGLFQPAAQVLETLQAPITEDQVRQAMSLSVQGTCWMELGLLQRAAPLIDSAIDNSPGVPTRYLFARGLLEMAKDDVEAVGETAKSILEGSLPPDNPDRTEDKAAAFLRGLAELANGNTDTAIEELTTAIALDGYDYATYRLALARAYLAAGRLQEAMAAARQASLVEDFADPRLDLDLDRHRALLVLAEVQEAMGRPVEAAAQASEFLKIWKSANPGLPDLERARRLARVEAAS